MVVSLLLESEISLVSLRDAMVVFVRLSREAIDAANVVPLSFARLEFVDDVSQVISGCRGTRNSKVFGIKMSMEMSSKSFLIRNLSARKPARQRAECQSSV